MKRLLLLSILFFAVLNSAFAQEGEREVPRVRFLVTGALEMGGDEVAQVQFTNGGNQSVKAGQGGSIAVGAQFQVSRIEKLLLRGTVGYKYVTTAADNAHIRLTRIPVQLTANYMVAPKIRIGAGVVTHQNIEFSTDGIGEDFSLKGATGAVFEVAYGIVGLSYTAMTYQDKWNNTYSANAIGITFSGVFPRK